MRSLQLCAQECCAALAEHFHTDKVYLCHRRKMRNRSTSRHVRRYKYNTIKLKPYIQYLYTVISDQIRIRLTVRVTVLYVYQISIQ